MYFLNEDKLFFSFNLGTSILPPSLNFFNISNKKEKQGPKPARTSTEKTSSTNTFTEIQKQESICQKNVTKVKPIVSNKKKVTSTLHKSITKLKTATSTVQALKKKYQEQRLAKQRIKNKFKTTCVMRTRSCTERSMLKTGLQLTPRKFLPRIKAKRHGLRSSVLPDKTNKSLSKTKVTLPKPKKKVNSKSKNSDTSNTDASSAEENDVEEDEEEELQVEKSTSQIKRNIQRGIQKKICTRSKSEMRRVTRSSSSTVTSQNLLRRPTRKTKEAAAVYMEILGRKLISPDIENDDNVSVESFPELPNARRIAQTENELKAKVKQNSTKTIAKTKDSKVSSFNSNANRRLDKSKNNKLILKSKRLMRVQKYCEEDSGEESEMSVGMNNTRPITRQSLGKIDKPISRSLRSSSKNTTVHTEVQNNANSKPKTQVQSCVKSAKEKFVIKRKREQNVSKTSLGKIKPKCLKTNQNEKTESEEETLGMLLSKIKKKKENDIEEEKGQIPDNVNNTKDGKIIRGNAQNIKADLSKVSDDEESFRGFTKKAISKVLNSCQTHANVNLLVTKSDEKLNLPKTLDISQTAEQSTTLRESKVETLVKSSSPVANSLNGECSVSVQDQKSVLDLSVKTQSSLLPSMEQTKCDHENEVSSNLMPLSTLHTRKERVNMSTEQIEKWLNESSLAKEESKLEMENVSSFRYDSAKEKLKTDVSHLSISTKIQHLVRPVNVTLSKLSDKTNFKDRTGIHSKNVIPVSSDMHNIVVKQQNMIIDKNKITTEVREVVKNKTEKMNKDTSLAEDTSDTVSKSDQNSVDGSIEKKSPTEKKIFQLRKPFLPKVKERKTVTPNANAFSPENESSVYAFESDTEVPVSTPFRRKIKDDAKCSTVMQSTAIVVSETKVTEAEVKKSNLKEDSESSDSKEKPSNDPVIPIRKEDVKEMQGPTNVAPSVNKFELPKNFASLTSVQVLPLDKLTTSWSNVNCSASIAVQVNLDETQEQENNASQQKSTEISTQTEMGNENDDDNDGQLFYIPLQAVTRSGPNLVQGQQLIQGVAVKLGTEGPTGPNQRVLLRAKLVTKPPLSVARCPPIGTVQPTTRTPPNLAAITVEQQVPSTSTTETVSTTISSMPSAETQLTSPAKNEVSVSSSNRQNVSATNTNNNLEKFTKSPKSSRERKTSIDSTKSGKR